MPMKQKKVSTTDQLAKKQKKKVLFPYKAVSVFSALLFVGLSVYLSYFQSQQSEALKNSPFNKRTVKMAEKVIRGSILAADGTVLAQTETDADGNEKRIYPFGSLFAHTVGYADNGSGGLELSMGSKLLESHDDITSQVQQQINEKKKKGDNLITTFIPEVQKAAQDALGENRGAAFVMDVKSGAVIADVSLPTFNPSTIAQDWSQLVSEENASNGTLMNRATQGLYPPGSTFKMVTALAYLRQFGSFDDFHYTCTGEYTHAGYTIHCAGGAKHGKENFTDAMANSCNSAFAYMATELINRNLIRQTADSVGFNQKESLQLPSSTSKFTLEQNSADQLTMQTAIGQGNTQATPMEMCKIAQAIANGGIMMEPQFVSRIENASGAVIKTISPQEDGSVMTGDEASALTKNMRAVVTDGTASGLNDLPYEIAGKTGTAQYGDVKEGKEHSWFVGFSQTGNKDIVVCVLIEDGGTKKVSAYKAAGKIFRAYFNAQDE